MNSATWSLRNPIPSILFFIIITLAGFQAFKNLPIQNFPDIELPTVSIMLNLPGAAPSQLETEVARKVEDSLATLSGLKHIRTAITDGVVNITAEFVLEKSLSDALIESKNAVDSVRSALPSDLLQPTVSALRIASEPLVTYAISSTTMDEEALSWFVDDTLSKTLLSVKGVGKFERIGGVQREIIVTVDPVRMSALKVSAAEISHALKQVQMESSGGSMKIGKGEQSIRTIAKISEASELSYMPIALLDGSTIRLDQVANITDGIAERTQKALYDGKPSIGFRFYRAKAFDETKVTKNVRSVLENMQKTRPDLNISEVNSSVEYTLEQYEGSMHMLYEGAILAVIVVWFFLGDFRATIISAVALPLSIIPTFAAMKWLGFSLNTLTLLGLAVVVGILVDDAIVEVENIVRHKQMGKPARKAVEDAVTEIALAVTATTLTLVVVFMPTSMMSGVPGLFFREFGWTIVISVMVSLAVARFITPLMAVYMLGDNHSSEKPDGPIMRYYLLMVNWCISHRKTTMFCTIAFFIASIKLMSFLPTGFIPASDRGYTNVSIELPPGSSIEQTVATSERARHQIEKLPGVKHVFTTIGGGQSAGGGVTLAGETRKGRLTIVFASRKERSPQTVIENNIRNALLLIPGARFTLSSGAPGEKMEIILSSENSAALTSTAQNLAEQLRSIPTLNNINTTASLDRPEILIRPDLARAAELGITTQTIGDTVRVATSGDFDSQLSKMNLDNRQVYIRVRMKDSDREDIDILSNMGIPSKKGITTLATIADITLT